MSTCTLTICATKSRRTKLAVANAHCARRREGPIFHRATVWTRRPARRRAVDAVARERDDLVVDVDVDFDVVGRVRDRDEAFFAVERERDVGRRSVMAGLRGRL